MFSVKELEPKEVFGFFEEISSIPRGSYHTKEISDYCVAFAEERGLWVRQDEWNNVIIKKAGTDGYENSDPVILQGHLDMVCEKTADSEHDFLNDPLALYVEDGFVKAKDTTLGADDGIAVAYALALLDSKTIVHPPLEVIFTIDEEVGMLGAEKLDLSDIKGKMLINLDSEDEGILLAGCAGGVDFTMDMPIELTDAEGDVVELVISGLKGGHSGVEIDRQRGNANKLAGRLLRHIDKQTNFALCSVDGGAKDNVITSSCRIRIVAKEKNRVQSLAEEMLQVWKNEFSADEPELTLEVRDLEQADCKVMNRSSMEKVIFFLLNCPNGVHEYNRSLKGLVETSDNLGVVETTADGLRVKILTRSGTASKLDEFKERLSSFAEFLGAAYSFNGEYPAWSYKEESRIRPITVAAYEKITGIKPEVATIHAGLECGLLSGKKPELDCISFGPQMYDIHSYNERLNIESTRKTWEILKEILRQCK